MKYTIEIDINLPREKVIELFDSEENLKYWQPGFVSFEHVSGNKGEAGAKSEMKYIMGKREIEMVETIVVSNFPEEFTATYEAKGVWNEIKNYFKVVDENTTKWVSENEFRCSGFMKIIAFLMPSSFKKQSCAFQEQFKDFAENGPKE